MTDLERRECGEPNPMRARAGLDDDARNHVQGNFRAARESAGESDIASRRVEADILREIHGDPSRSGEGHLLGCWVLDGILR